MEQKQRNCQVVNLVRTGMECDFDRQLSFGIKNVVENSIQAEALTLCHLFLRAYNEQSFSRVDELYNPCAETLLHLNGLQYVWSNSTCMTESECGQIEKAAEYLNVPFKLISHDVLNQFYRQLYDAVQRHGDQVMLSSESLLLLYDMKDFVASIIHIMQKCIRAGKPFIGIEEFLGGEITRSDLILECSV